MTQKQQEAIEVLNKHLTTEGILSKEEYFKLMDFIMESPSVQYIPYPQDTNPWIGGGILYKPYCDSAGEHKI